MSALLVPMCGYVQTVKGEAREIAFVDSISLKVCHNIRNSRSRVFDGLGK